MEATIVATATTTNTKMSLRIRNRQQKKIGRCSMCKKKLKKFYGTSEEYPFACWKCLMVINNNDNNAYFEKPQS
jgi:hypothetical protein